jgi:tRNA pseudouridine38-40 synthase
VTTEVGRASESSPAYHRTDVRNVRLTVAYDGTDFHGFAITGGHRTVMGELTEAVARVVRQPVELTGAGRTDAGVHGWGQVVTGMLPDDTDLRRLQRSLNGLCGPQIAVRSAEWAEPDFSARFSATSRCYHYDIWNHSEPNPLFARTSWHVPNPLDLDSMNEAAGVLIGDHDFSSFCRRPKPPKGAAPDDPGPSLVRRLTVAQWSLADTHLGPLTRFEIAATSFCHQMVRSIVGTLVDVGRGQRTVASMGETLAALDRSAASPVAPPQGLILWEVDYRGTRWNV